MSLMLIKKILDSKNNEQLLDAALVVDPATGRNIVQHVEAALNLLKDGTTDASGSLPEDYNTLLKIANSLSGLKTTINDFLTGEANEGDIDRLVELVNAINANKDSIDALFVDNLDKNDIVNTLTSTDTAKVLSAAQGKALKDLIDALETSVNEKLAAVHSHANKSVLDSLAANADGNLEYNGHALDGKTSVGIVADAGDTPVFDERLTLVVSQYTAPAAGNPGE